MRFLAIDYGIKRVGLALSDEFGRLAYPYSVLPNNLKLVKEIVRICQTEKVGGLVLGWSLDYHRNDNPIMRKVYDLRDQLANQLNLPIELEDEVLTTYEAEREIGVDDFTDARAAAIILRTYLDRRNIQK